MPQIIEDALTAKLAAWIDSKRSSGLPDASLLPVHVANRDEIRSRPCVVLNPAESKPIPAMPNTARVKLDVHLFSQVDDTPAATHAEWTARLVALLRDKTAIQADLDSPSFVLHDLIGRESTTTPDDARGRESVLSYEAVVSAI